MIEPKNSARAEASLRAIANRRARRELSQRRAQAITANDTADVLAHET